MTLNDTCASLALPQSPFSRQPEGRRSKIEDASVWRRAFLRNIIFIKGEKREKEKRFFEVALRALREERAIEDRDKKKGKEKEEHCMSVCRGETGSAAGAEGPTVGKVRRCVLRHGEKERKGSRIGSRPSPRAGKVTSKSRAARITCRR